MNERILELADEATTQKQIVVGDEFQLAMSVEFFDKEKFAELIVRECAEVSNQAEKQCQHPGTMIKQHFGVEE